MTADTHSTALLCQKLNCSRSPDCSLAQSQEDSLARLALNQTLLHPGSRSYASRPAAIALAHGTAIGLVAFSSLLGLSAIRFVDTGSVALIYLIPVVITAAKFDLSASVTAAVGAALAYDLFFLPHTSVLALPTLGAFTRLLVFLGIGLLTFHLVSNLKAKSKVMQAQAQEQALLAEFARKLNSLTDPREVAEALVRQISGAFDVKVGILLPKQNTLTPVASAPNPVSLGDLELRAAEECFETRQRTASETDGHPDHDWLFVPLATNKSTFGVICLQSATSSGLAMNGRCIASMICDQATVVLERLQLTQEQKRAAEIEARDRALSALLASIGHDLRTPLSIVIGSIFELKRHGINSAAARTIIETLEDEAIGVSRLVTNLLEMSRLETGNMPMKVEPVDLVDAVTDVQQCMKREFRRRRIVCDVSPDLPLVWLDPVFFRHCLINLLDNAIRHGEPGGTIEITATRHQQGVEICVSDHGQGLQSEIAIRIAKMFACIEPGDRRTVGRGLGLRIVKDFSDAMGLTVTTGPRRDGANGSTFSLLIPTELLILHVENGRFE